MKWWKCSECGQVIYSETEKDRREYHAFCGRCGAKMVEPQESEEKV
jgi:DNA-directed RNA polymerase subunit RPC12/RpoP